MKPSGVKVVVVSGNSNTKSDSKSKSTDQQKQEMKDSKTTPKTKSQDDHWLVKAEHWFQQRAWKKTIPILEQGLEQWKKKSLPLTDLERYNIYSNLSFAYFNEHDTPKAIEYGTQALELNPRGQWGCEQYLNRGLFYFQSNELFLALEDYNRVRLFL